MSANSHQESPWMGSVGLGLLLLGVAGGVLTLSFIGYSVTHSHAIWTGGRVATILIGFYGMMGVIAGLVNSSVEAGGGDDHGSDDHGHDAYGHHGSFSPLIIGAGTMLFLYGFVESYTILGFGLLVIFLGAFNWWREDYPNDGKDEMKSLGQPYKGQDVRKVGLWVFLMSEVLIFGSFFSSYLRMRMGWSTHWNEECNSMLES